jgi:hypothetical protein
MGDFRIAEKLEADGIELNRRFQAASRRSGSPSDVAESRERIFADWF